VLVYITLPHAQGLLKELKDSSKTPQGLLKDLKNIAKILSNIVQNIR
jgi:hypothetical protein